MIIPKSTIQSVNATAKRPNRTGLGKRATRRAGYVCKGSKSGLMRCNTGGSGPLIHPMALRLHRLTGAGSVFSAFLHVFVTNECRAGWRSSNSRLLRGVAAFEGVSSGVNDDDPLVAIWSLLPPTSRSTCAAVAVAVLFAMFSRRYCAAAQLMGVVVS